MTNDSELKFFCIGMGLGVAAGFLLAPRSGAETRRMIQKRALDGSDYLRNQVSSGVEAAVDAVDRGGKTLRHQSENLAAAVEAGKAAYAEAAASTPSLG